MNTRRIGTAGAVVTILALLTSTVPGGLLGRVVDGWTSGGTGTLPLLGTVGETVLIYNYAVGAVEQFLPLAFGVGLGVWLTRHVAADDLPRALRAVAAGSVVVVAVSAIALSVVWGGFDLTGLAMLFGLVAELVVAGPVQVTVATAGGISLSQFGLLGGGRFSSPTPERSTQQTDTAESADDAASLTQRP